MLLAVAAVSLWMDQRGLIIILRTIALVRFCCESDIETNLAISKPTGSALLTFLLAIQSSGICHWLLAAEASTQHQLELSFDVASLWS